MEEESGNIKDEIKKLSESIQDLKNGGKKNVPRVKKFRMPLNSRISPRKAKNNYAIVCYVNENKEVRFLTTPVKEGSVMIDGAPHLASANYMLSYKKRPFIIIPSWNTKPFSPEKNYDDAARNKTTAYGYRLLLNIMKSQGIDQKKKISWGTVAIGLLVIAALAYFATQGGLF